MQYYRVPFDTKGEEKLAFNLTLREIMILSTGGGIGLFVSWVASLIISTQMLFCTPFAIPFVGVAMLLAFVKINRDGCVMTLEKYLYRKFIYEQRPRHYLKIREEL
jgi:hypothetical protein